MVTSQLVLYPLLLSGAQPMTAPEGRGSPSTGKPIQNTGHGRIQALNLRYQVRTQLVSQGAQHKRPDQVHLRNCPTATLLLRPRVVLYPRHGGLEQVGE